eukprot:g41353.t1
MERFRQRPCQLFFLIAGLALFTFLASGLWYRSSQWTDWLHGTSWWRPPHNTPTDSAFQTTNFRAGQAVRSLQAGVTAILAYGPLRDDEAGRAFLGAGRATSASVRGLRLHPPTLAIAGGEDAAAPLLARGRQQGAWPWAQPTGQPEDVVVGRLLQFAVGPWTSPGTFAERLAAADRLHGYRPEQPNQGLWRRAVVKAETVQGQKQAAYIYYQEGGGAEAGSGRAGATAGAAGAAGPGAGRRVVLIGAGVGSLVTASLLAQAGYEVEVLEKNGDDLVGGRLNQVWLAGRRFELGPSLLLLPDVYNQTFAALGLQLAQLVELRRVTPTYLAYFADHDSLVLDPRHAGFPAALERLEPGSFARFKAYLRSAETNLQGGWPNFIEQTLRADLLPAFLWNALSVKNWPLQSQMSSLRQYFKSPKLQALFSFQALYVGLSPYRAPAIFSLLQAIELSQGVYYPLGGFQQIATRLLQRAQQLGVRFRFNASVERILTVGGRATGVRVRGGQDVLLRPGDVLVANPDLPYVEEHLLPADVARDTRRYEFSSSVVSFYFSTRKRFSALGHHTICLSKDYERSWAILEAAANHSVLPADFNFYVHAPARTDPSAAPEGGDSIMVLVPTPPLPAGLSDAEAKRLSDGWVMQARAGVLRRFHAMPDMHDFEKHIEAELVRSPLQWRELYSLSRGAVFGLSCKLSQLSVLRPSCRHPRLGNLYFVGASTRPGNGVPLVMTGARLLAKQIQREQPLHG